MSFDTCGLFTHMMNSHEQAAGVVRACACSACSPPRRGEQVMNRTGRLVGAGTLPCRACGRPTPLDRLRHSLRNTLYCQRCLDEEAGYYEDLDGG